MTNLLKNVNLFGEDVDGAISVLIDANGDIVDESPVARVYGHHLYCCTLDEARNRIAQQGLDKLAELDASTVGGWVELDGELIFDPWANSMSLFA